MVRLEQQKKDGFGQIQSFKKEFSGEKQSENQLFVLGSLSNTFVCSHDFPQSLGMRKKVVLNSDNEKSRFTDSDDEVKALYAELHRLEKKEETWQHWAREYAHSPYGDSCEKE